MSAKKDPLRDALDKIRKERDLRIAPMSEMELDVQSISTGNLSLDSITGVGGVPLGRITELYGPPSSGKTTCALQTVARAQSNGRRALYLDYEHSLDPVYCTALGVNLDDLLLSQPDTLEDGLNAMRELVKTGKIDLVVLDSLGAMTSERELEADTGDMKFSARDRARIMAQFMRQTTAELHDNSSALIILNHLQDVMPMGFFEQQLAAQGRKRTTTPGGNAPKFHASMRIEFKNVGNVRTKEWDPTTGKNEDVPTQTKVRVVVTKNKVGPPFRQAELRVRFGRGFSNEWSALTVLAGCAAIRNEKGTYRLDEDTADPTGAYSKDFVRGEDAFVELLEGTPEWGTHLIAMATKVLEREPTAAAPAEDVISPEEINALLT